MAERFVVGRRLRDERDHGPSRSCELSWQAPQGPVEPIQLGGFFRVRGPARPSGGSTPPSGQGVFADQKLFAARALKMAAAPLGKTGSTSMRGYR
jgi:hypothetical protein